MKQNEASLNVRFAVKKMRIFFPFHPRKQMVGKTEKDLHLYREKLFTVRRDGGSVSERVITSMFAMK